MEKRQKFRRLWRWLLLSAIGVTTLVIWHLSLIPAGASGQQSERFVVSVVTATRTGGDFFDYLFVFVRKMAHFIEFFGLGLLWGLYGRVRRLPFMWLYGLAVGIADEALQALAPGRSPGFWDVALDYCGYFCGFALVFAVADRLVCRKNRKLEK